MKKFLTIALLPMMLNALTLAQGWEKSYGGLKDDIAYDVIKSADGGYIAVGSTNSFGAGGTDVFVVKINSTGVLKWTKVIGGTADDVGYSVAEASNGDILIAGATESFGAGNKDAYLIKLGPTGAIKWTKTYGTPASDEARTVIISGSRYFISGSSNGNFYLAKTDWAGVALWEKNYGSASSEICYDMVRTFDNSLVMAGYTAGYGNNHVYVVKTDINGDTLFTNNFYEGNSSPGATGIAETNDHGLVMTGFSYGGTGYGDLFLLKISSNGTQAFNTTGTALANSGTKVCATTDGGVAVVGDHCNFGCTMEILKYNSAGTEQWHNSSYQYAVFNSYNTFSGGYAIRRAGSGYVACGYTRLPTGNNSDFLIVKTDTGGVSQPAISLSANGPTSFCSPGSVTFTAPAGYLSYQWRFVSTTHQLTYIAGANTNSYTASVSGYYSCLMKDANNDVRKGSASVNVIPVTPATITTSGPAAFCASAGQSLTLTANPSSGYTYQWKLNGSNISSATYSNYNPVTSGNYSVFISNSCTTSTSANLAVNNAAPPPVPVISYVNGIPPTLFQCANSSTYSEGSLQISPVAGATYQWFHNGVVMNGATSNTVFPYYNNENYTCTVTAPCGVATSAAFTGSYSSVMIGQAIINASGPTSGCGVSSVTLGISGFSFSYQWYHDFSLIPGAYSDTYTATVSGSYLCEYYDDYCGYSQSQPIQVDISTSPSPAISAVGPASVCVGPVTLNATPTGPGITYSWYKDNVAIGVNGSTYSASASGNYKCYVTQPFCGAYFSNIIYVSVGVPVNNTITASATTICSAGNSTLSVNGPQTGQTFQWQLNGVNIGGATSSSYTTNAAGNYKCNITNTCGTVASNTITTTVIPSPVATITGNTVICPGGFVTLTANSSPGYTYQWYRYNNYLISGSTQQTYNATIQSLFYVMITSANGCTAFSNSIQTMPGSLPAATVSTSQYPFMCKGDTIQLRAATDPGYSYQWKKSGNNIAGATGYFYTTSDSGLYSVTVTNTCGTSNATSPYAIQLKSQPSAIITPQGSTTFCNGDSVTLAANTATGLYYTWKKNGSIISGATAASYIAKTAGTFKVTVTNSNGCSKTSAGVVISIPCRQGETTSYSLQEIRANVYPNPYAETFTLFIEGIESDTYHIIIRDILGRTVADERTVPAGNEVQLGNNLSPGFYLVELVSGEKRKVLRVEKL